MKPVFLRGGVFTFQFFPSLHKCGRSDISGNVVYGQMLQCYVKMLSHAKDLNPDICGKHLI